MTAEALWSSFATFWLALSAVYVWIPATRKELFPLMHYFGWACCAFFFFREALHDDGFMRAWDIFITICYLISWWGARHDGDDRWKKRRKKALSKVRVVGHKLVVVPVRN